MIWFAAAAGWGFSEAVFFFFVPDLLLSLAVLQRGFRFALKLAAAAALSAVAGGVIMYRSGMVDAQAALAFLDTVPAIQPWLIEQVREHTDNGWIPALFTGSITGEPYKIHAVLAGEAGRPVAFFLVASFFARFARFALTISLTGVVAVAMNRLGLAPSRKKGVKLTLLALVWIAIYLFYFNKMGF